MNTYTSQVGVDYMSPRWPNSAMFAYAHLRQAVSVGECADGHVGLLQDDQVDW